MTGVSGPARPTTAGATEIEAIRAFNRFYTRKTGLLQRHLLDSPYSLTEVRVLYELAHRKDLTATDLRDSLGIDRGYLSRLLRQFEKKRLITRKRSRGDARSSLLRLTAAGRAVYADLNVRQSEVVARMLDGITKASQQNLVTSMRTIMAVLADDATGPARQFSKGTRARHASGQAPNAKLELRAHRPGDMGWVMFTHGELYFQEYDWDERFEALVGEIVVNFIRRFDQDRERCWIAEIDGERVGSIFLVKDTETVAKLRLLLVTPSARGKGVGTRLVDECIAFAREARYRTLTLWTNSVLHAARRIYEARGFRLVKEEPHASFGHNLTGQYWELEL